MFATLDELDARLATRRFLFGDAPVETDWRLFTTLLRFDAVYAIHFKCSLRRVVDYPHLWPYARDLYQQPGIADDRALRRHPPPLLPHAPWSTRAASSPSAPDEDLTRRTGRG